MSRRLTSRRKIINEDEVIAILLKLDFEIIYFETLNFIQQVELAVQTKVFIGQHGAGLTNMLFMQQGSSVMELRLENDKTNLCYFSLASALDHNYYYQFCEKHHQDKTNFDADFIVNIERLESNLTLILNDVT